MEEKSGEHAVLVHSRVNGWCQSCGGLGNDSPYITHINVNNWELTDVEHLAMIKATTYTVKWRVGKKLGRTIYAITGDDHGDVLLGMMETRALAEYIVERHNTTVV